VFCQQRRVEGFYTEHTALCLAFMYPPTIVGNAVYACKVLFGMICGSTTGSRRELLVQGNSLWLLYFRLMRDQVGMGLLPIDQPRLTLDKERKPGAARTMISSATKHPVSATASVM